MTNAGDVPVAIAADARVLSLEITPRGERKPTRCELPADMRPADNLDRALVLAPGRSYTEAFEPRLYCFGERGLGALVPGAIVVARLGWPPTSRDGTRQAVWPLEGVEPARSSLPSLVSAPVALYDDPTPTPTAVATPSAQDAEPANLHLRGSRSVDADSLESISVNVTLRNDGARPVCVRFRPDTLRFEVTTSAGTARCPWPVPPSAAMREALTTLRPGGSDTLSVLVSAYCPRQLFATPGLVVLRPELDTRKAGGEALDVRTFSGEVIATTPVVVRLHHGTSQPRLVRPAADPPPSP